MKNRMLTVASLCLVVALAVVSASAQATVQARVPFPFVVLGKTFPAGEYMLITNPHQVKIEDTNRRVVAYVLADEVSDRSTRKRGQIIFRCYGDRCFLAEVWPPSLEQGRELLTSRAEAELAREQSGKYFAVLGKTPKGQ